MATEEKARKPQEEASIEDYPLGEVPEASRRGMYSMATVLLGFTFFTSTMFAGGRVGSSFVFWPDLMVVILLGNLLLGIYVAILGYVAYKTGYSSVVLTRYSFGDKGSKVADFLFGITQVGWYAWGTATMAIVMVSMLGLSESLTIPLMVVFGLGFCWTSFFGFKGLSILSVIAVPAMVVLIVLSFRIAFVDVGGIEGLLANQPTETITFAQALTIVFGTFVSGGTQAANWIRFSKSARVAIIASLSAFFIGNGLMIFAGAFGGYVYQEPDLVKVLVMQGLWLPAVILLFLNVWTTQDNTIYSFSVAGCNFFRSEKRRLFNVVGAVIGTILAILGMYDWLVPYIVLLSTLIPPIGGVIIADFFIKNRAYYPRLRDVKLGNFNYTGLLAYFAGALTAYYGPIGIPPITGIIVSIIAYVIIDRLLLMFNIDSRHQVLGG